MGLGGYAQASSRAKVELAVVTTADLTDLKKVQTAVKNAYNEDLNLLKLGENAAKGEAEAYAYLVKEINSEYLPKLRAIGTAIKQNEASAKAAAGQMGFLSSVSLRNARELNLITVPMAAGVAAMTAAIALSAKGAIDLQQNMATVASILTPIEREIIPAMTEGVKKLAIEVGQSTKDISRGLYDILSAGIKTSDSMEVLRVSAIAATAGVYGTMNEAATAIVAVLNAYNLKASESTRVSDVMFQTVKDGVTTFPELTAALGNVLPAAAGAGVKLEELGAAISVMTRQGMNAAKSTISLNTAINQIQDPTKSKEAVRVMKQYGIALDAQTLAQKGLMGIVEEMVRKNIGDAQIEQLFPEQRAARAMKALVHQYEMFKDEVKRHYESAGAAADAFNVQTQTVAFQMKQLKEAVGILAGEMGSSLLPAIKAGAEAASKLLEWFRSLDADTKGSIATFAVLSTTVLGLTTAFLYLVSRLPGIIAGFNTIRDAVNALKASYIALKEAEMAESIMKTAGAFGIAGLAVAAVGTAMLALYKNDEECKKQSEEVRKATMDRASAMGYLSQSTIQYIRDKKALMALEGKPLEIELPTGDPLTDRIAQLKRDIEALSKIVFATPEWAKAGSPFTAQLKAASAELAKLLKQQEALVKAPTPERDLKAEAAARRAQEKALRDETAAWNERETTIKRLIELGMKKANYDRESLSRGYEEYKLLLKLSPALSDQTAIRERMADIHRRAISLDNARWNRLQVIMQAEADKIDEAAIDAEKAYQGKVAIMEKEFAAAQRLKERERRAEAKAIRDKLKQEEEEQQRLDKLYEEKVARIEEYVNATTSAYQAGFASSLAAGDSFWDSMVKGAQEAAIAIIDTIEKTQSAELTMKAIASYAEGNILLGIAQTVGAAAIITAGEVTKNE